MKTFGMKKDDSPQNFKSITFYLMISVKIIKILIRYQIKKEKKHYNKIFNNFITIERNNS